MMFDWPSLESVKKSYNIGDYLREAWYTLHERGLKMTREQVKVCAPFPERDSVVTTLPSDQLALALRKEYDLLKASEGENWVYRTQLIKNVWNIWQAWRVFTDTSDAHIPRVELPCGTTEEKVFIRDKGKIVEKK